MEQNFAKLVIKVEQYMYSVHRITAVLANYNILIVT